ncbi:Tat pathway signal protein [Streptomyces sp. NPDC002463]|uniref:Tat pathway signal protein n=1 Tax=Streptomyces sp. NPDC002463 TaxID=3364645 RepID=UPI003691D325
MSRRLLRAPWGRGRKVTVMVAVVVAFGGGGWAAGTRMQSPADAAAAHQPPKAGPVTVAVERRKLTATLVAQGTVEFGAPRSVALAGAVASSGSAADGPAAQLVTKLPQQGAVLTEGSVLMQVSGRPVFVLRGQVPMYRTLGPGASGDDVRQLQLALRRIGQDPGGAGGHYGQGTAGAVTRWYASKGYEAQAPGPEEQKQRGELEQSVTDAQLGLLQAQAGQGAAGGHDGGASSPAASDATRALELKSAKNRLDQANKTLSLFLAAYGTRVPAGEVVFLPDLPVRVDKVKVHLGDTPDGAVATVTSSDVVVQAVVPAADAAQLRQGMPARIETTDGRQVTGVVARVGGAVGSATGGGTGRDGGAAAGDGAGSEAPVPVAVSVPEPGVLKNQAGAAVKATVDLGSSKGAVLVVPVAAVHTSADGQARVRVLRGGRIVDVPVTPGLSAAGQVEVTPRDVPLGEGDQVVVGQ